MTDESTYPTPTSPLTDEEWHWLFSKPYPRRKEIFERFRKSPAKLIAAFNDQIRGDDDRQISPRIMAHLESVLNAARAHYDMLEADAADGDALLEAITEARRFHKALSGYVAPPGPSLSRWLDPGPTYFLSDGTRVRPPVSED